MSSFFDHLNAINDTKKNLLREDPQSASDYVPFMVNRGLSYFHDTIFYANEINQYAEIPKLWQFEFYLHSVPRKRRFAKWAKKETVVDDVKLIVQEYGYSTSRAMEVLDLFTEEQLNTLREKHETGGR